MPLPVADYQCLPEDARGVLPSAVELEAVTEDELDHPLEGNNPSRTAPTMNRYALYVT